MNIQKFLFFSIILIIISSKSYSQNADKVLLKIGDEETTVEEFWNIYTKNNTDKSIDKKSIDDYLDLYINFRLKVTEAKFLKKDTLPSFKKELAGYREQLAKPYLVDENINDQLIREAYDRMLKDVRVSHILLLLDADALAEDTLKTYTKLADIKNQINNGSISFADAAVKYSDDRSARNTPSDGKRPERQGNKGDLGYFTVFDMVYPFEVAAYETPIGEISDPVRTRFGYHLIYKTDEIPAIGKAKVAHIFVRQMPNDTSISEEDAEQKIRNIYARIQGGEKFDELVKTMSDDKGSAAKGGELPIFGANRMVPEFIKQVSEFDSIGQISEPIKTMYGWHIVKFLEKKPVGSFESKENEIKDRLKKDVRSEKGRQSKIAQVKKEENFKEFPESLKALIPQLDSTLLDHRFNAEKISSLNATLFKIGDESFSQSDLINYIQKSSKKADSKNLARYVNSKYVDFVDDMVIDYEDRHLEEKYRDFDLLMREYSDGILLFDLMNEKVWSKATTDTMGYESYFNSHRSDYKWDKRVEASIFTFKNDSIAPFILAMAQLGKKDEDILSEIYNDSLNLVRYERGKFEKGQNENIDAVKWKDGQIEMINSEEGKPQYMVRIHERLQPTNKELDECRGLVISDYQNQLEKEWLAALKEKFTVSINEEVLKDVKQNGLTE
jgi:peptidyl-prolyl cis-trans isomerase SurA